MARTSFKLDSRGFSRALSQAVSHFSDTNALASEIGEAMVASTRQRFADEKGPDGKKWKKSRRAETSGGQTLSDKGILKGSIGYEATSNAVAWGSADAPEKAGAHQAGAIIRPKKGKFLKFAGQDGQDVFVKEVEVPARPFIGFNDDDQAETLEIVAEYMEKGFK